MNPLEIAAEVADLGIAAIGGHGLNGGNHILQQLRGAGHSYIEQVLAEGFADLPVEEAQKAGFSYPEQGTDLLRTDVQSASVFLDDSQQNADAWVHFCVSFIWPGDRLPALLERTERNVAFTHFICMTFDISPACEIAVRRLLRGGPAC